MFDRNNPLYQDPHISYPIHDIDLSFADYCNICQKLITTYRCDLKDSLQAQTIINANSPYELLPENKSTAGAVLLHGLYDCPFTLREVADVFQKNNITVRAHLLPGHGTVPGALLDTTYHDWIAATNFAISNMQKDVEKIFLVGFSTGAALLLHHVLRNANKKIAGLIMLAPAIQLYSAFSFAVGWPRLIDWIWTRAKWLRVAAETDYAKYQSFTFNSAYQIYCLTRIIKEMTTEKIPIPLFAAISEGDRTVFSSATLKYFQTYANENSKLLIYTDKPANYEDKRIIERPEEISHVAMPFSKNNPHYGINGDYKFMPPSFNPDFEFLMERLLEFVGN